MAYRVEIQQQAPNGALIQRCARGRSRFYVVQDDPRVAGVELPSVTTILQILAKPQLIPWATKQGRLAYHDHLRPHLGEMLTQEMLDEAMEKAASRPEEARQIAADRGTEVHAVIAAYRSREDMSPDIMRMVANFDSWLNDSGYVVEHHETMLYSPDLFAGTCDLVLRRDGQTWLADLKTGNAWPEHAMQLAAYARAWTSLTEEHVVGAIAISLAGDQAKIHAVADLDASYKAFQAAYDLWAHSRQNPWRS